MLGRVRPTNLGVNDGKLAACPESPNCVSTQATRESQRIAPLKMEKSLTEVTTVAREVILAMPRAKFVTQAIVVVGDSPVENADQEPNYCHVECTSLICRYIDDLEIWIDIPNRLIHARSASRLGHSDLGVNRKRVDAIFEKLVESGVASRTE